MKIKTINYQKLFPLGAFMNERIGVEVQLDEGEDPTQVLISAKKMVEMWHKATNPGVYVEEPGLPDQSYESLTPEQQQQSLEQTIQNCKTVDELKSYRMVVYAKGSSHTIQELYETRLRALKQTT